MTPQDIRVRVKSKPFTPLWVVTANGQQHLLLRPEFAFVTTSVLYVFTTATPDDGIAAGRPAVFRNSDIVALEPAPVEMKSTVTSADILELLDADPFIPIRVVMTSGMIHEIKYQECAYVVATPPVLLIMPGVEPGSKRATDLPIRCPLHRIAALELLGGQAA